MAEYRVQSSIRYVLFFSVLALVRPAHGQEVSRYEGMCDASAAVALDREHFAVANDERNVLLIYRRGTSMPVDSVPLSRHLGTKEDQESDIEGAAEFQGRIYWITSHGRSSAGKKREVRQRLFATDIVTGTTPPKLRSVGEPYSRLLDDFVQSDALRPYGLGKAAKLAPEAPGGLNIEGLAATISGELLLGFRSPIPGGRALIVPLENPRRMLHGARARLGPPLLLDLGGRGIRSLERVGSQYFIVAGPPGDDGDFAMYRWSGRQRDVPTRLAAVDFGSLRPEAMFAIPGTSSLQILSDDGGTSIRGVTCKTLPSTEQSFRSVQISP